MTLTLIIIAWFAIITGFVHLNWRIVKKKKRSPRHKWWFLLRVVVGLLFLWACWYAPIERDQFWALPVMMVFTFWPGFDGGMALSLGHDVWYLDIKTDKEEDSWIDGLQTRWGREPLFVIFFFKVLLAVASIALFVYGYSAIGTY